MALVLGGNALLVYDSEVNYAVFFCSPIVLISQTDKRIHITVFLFIFGEKEKAEYFTGMVLVVLFWPNSFNRSHPTISV